LAESISGQNGVPRLYARDSDKIPFQSRIGTKLIIGFLIIASITGLVGYFSLNYSQTVGDKFHLLVLHSLPAIDSLKEIKAEKYVFSPSENKVQILQEITNQKSRFKNNLSIYEDLVNKFFPDETDLNESIRNSWASF